MERHVERARIRERSPRILKKLLFSLGSSNGVIRQACREAESG